MTSDAEKLYMSRKLGKGMGTRYRISSMFPLLILLLVTAALSFALTFITSISVQIDRMIAIMGSGSLYALSDPSEFITEGESDAVKTGSALLYAENGEAAISVKGVEPSYFSRMRKDEMEIVFLDGEVLNPVVISSSLAARLSLSQGDRFSILVWDEEGARARPFLCTVKGIFSSVYPQLDSHIAYVPFSMLSSKIGYEVLLPEGSDPEALSEILWEHGILSETYRTMYASLYSNVQSSVGILYVILVAVALLAAFFSSDAAQVYIERDRKDIKALWMLGLERKRLKSIYLKITLFLVTVASLSGCILGLFIAYLSPLVLAVISHYEPALLEYYVTSFRVHVPYTLLIMMLLASLFVSFISVSVSLRRREGTELF